MPATRHTLHYSSLYGHCTLLLTVHSTIKGSANGHQRSHVGPCHADVLPAYGASSLRAALVPADQVLAQPVLEQAPAQPMQTDGGAALQAAEGQLPAGPAAELPVFTHGEQGLGALTPTLFVEMYVLYI